MLLCTSCWSLFPAYCGYYWTGCICLNCWQYFTKLENVFVQKKNYPNWSVLINYWGYYWIGHFSFCSKAGSVIEARAKCIGLKSNQWKEVISIFSRTSSFYKCQLLNSCNSPKYVWYNWKEQRTQRLKNICWQLKVQKLKSLKVESLKVKSLKDQSKLMKALKV